MVSLMSKMYCPKCKKEVTVTKKMWSTYICDECSTIIQSDKGIDKVNG